METRKRHIAEDGEASLPKKRALIDVRDSPTPQLNGNTVNPDEPKDDNLERFRKEAIYRKMKHYSREFERSQARIAELERWRRSCEAGLAALEACWTQLVDTTRSLVGPSDGHVDVRTDDLFDLSSHISESESTLAQALQGRVEATKSLLVTLIQRGGSPALLQDKSFQKCREAQAECTALRSELTVLRSRLIRVETERDNYHAELVSSEKKNDRLKSQTVQEMSSSGPPPPLPDAKATPDGTEGGDTPVPSSSSPPPAPPQSNGAHAQEDNNEWQAIAALREQKILALESELASLKDQLVHNQFDQQSPSEATVTHTSYYKALLDRYNRLEKSSEDTFAEMGRLRTELTELQSTRTAFEEDVVAEQNKALQELRTMLAKRDSENLRLREQRDQQMSELMERKQKEAIKLTSMQELKSLSESRSERITVLQSEVTRLRTQLAANAGSADILAFFFRDQNVDANYITDLQKRLEAAESKAQALDQSLSGLQSTNAEIAQCVKSEADARQQLSESNTRLQAYASMFGDLSNAPADAKAREDELQRLRLQVSQNDQASSALDSELDRLSAAWEALDRQVSSKVFDLSAMEERMVKTAHEKVKIENKFYAAMRDKEASENERKNIARNIEKQAKALERLVASEKSFSSQVADLEREVALLNKAQTLHRDRISVLEGEVSEWKGHASYEKSRVDQANKFLHDTQRSLDKRKADLRRMEEDLLRSKKDLERQTTKVKTSVIVPSGSSKEAALQSEVDKCMSILKCSTCRMRMRNTVITKCMHSFCKDCVDARISTRQRKCPACNLPFAQSDVAQLYFQ